MHPPQPLVVRAGLSRTFGSLAGFAALAFLSLGVYLLADAFAHPVDAQPAALIVAAFAIAISLLLFYFLFKPRRILESFGHEALQEERHRQARASSPALPANVPRNDLRNDLLHQRAYVDRSRIRP